MFEQISNLWNSPSTQSNMLDLLTLAQNSLIEQKKPLNWIDVISVIALTGLALFAVCKTSWRR